MEDPYLDGYWLKVDEYLGTVFYPSSATQVFRTKLSDAPSLVDAPRVIRVPLRAHQPMCYPGIARIRVVLHGNSFVTIVVGFTYDIKILS